MGESSTEIAAGCHCGNVRFELRWPESVGEIRVRECGCSFCRKHGAAWTSHREAELSVAIEDPSLLSRYEFGTATAQFYVCSRCGVVPFAISEIEGRRYAVVNANAFEGVDAAKVTRTPTSFDGEETGERLERRRRTWIPAVRI